MGQFTSNYFSSHYACLGRYLCRINLYDCCQYALIMNYRTAEEQNNSIKDNAASALTMGTIILAAGSFLGILSGTGMLDSIAMDTVKVIPDFISPYIHLVIGFFGLPF